MAETGFAEFDCLVLGDDPAGLWALGELEKRSHGKLRLGYVSFEPHLRPVALPTAIARRFDIPVTKTWSPEMVSPQAVLSWDPISAGSRFPELALLASHDGWLDSPSRLVRGLKGAIQQNPDLIGFGRGLALAFGRTGKVSPEWAALYAWLFTELCWWRPADALSKQIRVFHANPRENSIEKIAPMTKTKLGYAVQLQGYEPLFSQWVILNLPSTPLRTILQKEEVCENLGISFAQEPIPSKALFPLTLTLDPTVVPLNVRPVSVFFDSWEIPDPEAEILPFEISRTQDATRMTLWIHGARDFSLDSLLSQCRAAIGKMNRLFPFLSGSIRHIEPTLDLESCYSEDARRFAIETFEDSLVEIYDYCWLHSRLRLPRVERLGPLMNAHLPYPWGSLHTAREVVEPMLKHLMKPILKAEKHAQAKEEAARRKSTPRPGARL